MCRNFCQCGHELGDNADGRHQLAGQAPDGKWVPDERFTRAVPSTAFGEIEFSNTSQSIAKVLSSLQMRYCTFTCTRRPI